MALFSPSESPAVVVKEIDLTGGVPNVQSTTGAIVGNYRWGPVEKRTLIANETELVETFASPDSSNTVDFHSASFFLRYSSNLQVVRAITSTAENAFSTTRATKLTGQEIIIGDSSNNSTTTITNGATFVADSANTLRLAVAAAAHLAQDVVIKNEDHFDGQFAALSDLTKAHILSTTDSDGAGNNFVDSAASNALDPGNHTWIARYPGDLGNSLRVDVCPANTTAFDAWDYKASFDAAPGTSTFLTNNSTGVQTNDEVHVAVVDKNGRITGTKGTVLETYPFLSMFKNATNEQGSSIYAKDVVNERSEYVYWVNWDSDYRAEGANTILSADDSANDTNLNKTAFNAAASFTFQGGVNSTALGMSEFATGYDLFEDKDQVEIDFLISPSMADRTSHDQVATDLISTAAQRKDCVAVFSPARDDVVNLTNSSTITTNITATSDAITPFSSYAFMDGNFLKVYDKFNDQFIFIPAASSTAGLMAATDLNRAAWFSPAGSRRGQYLGITSLAWTPTKGERDSLYKKSVNPIANIPGSGVILFGDKTGLRRSSAFDRINVRRLFLVLERAISRAAEQVLFEFNDEFTRAEFVNIIEPVLREVKGRRGITDFRVVADATNNTPEVIDRNEFRADIFIKPARSINFVTLNFVAVRTGVDFEEVVGTV